MWDCHGRADIRSAGVAWSVMSQVRHGRRSRGPRRRTPRTLPAPLMRQSPGRPAAPHQNHRAPNAARAHQPHPHRTLGPHQTTPLIDIRFMHRAVEPAPNPRTTPDHTAPPQPREISTWPSPSISTPILKTPHPTGNADPLPAQIRRAALAHRSTPETQLGTTRHHRSPLISEAPVNPQVRDLWGWRNSHYSAVS
jgi:hypothetical protein